MTDEFIDTILAIDPSGSGTTGVCLARKNKLSFWDFKSPSWEEHLRHLFEEINKNKPNIVLFETSNYIRCETQSTLDLFKIMGAIVSLKYCFSFIDSLETVAVNQVKNFKRKLFEKEIVLDSLIYQAGRGKGWIYEGMKISVHQLDAFIVFFLWKERMILKKTSNI